MKFSDLAMDFRLLHKRCVDLMNKSLSFHSTVIPEVFNLLYLENFNKVCCWLKKFFYKQKSACNQLSKYLLSWQMIQQLSQILNDFRFSEQLLSFFQSTESKKALSKIFILSQKLLYLFSKFLPDQRYLMCFFFHLSIDVHTIFASSVTRIRLMYINTFPLLFEC